MPQDLVLKGRPEKSSFTEAVTYNEVARKVDGLCRGKAVQAQGTRHRGPELSAYVGPPRNGKEPVGLQQREQGEGRRGEMRESKSRARFCRALKAQRRLLLFRP